MVLELRYIISDIPLFAIAYDCKVSTLSRLDGRELLSDNALIQITPNGFNILAMRSFESKAPRCHNSIGKLAPTCRSSLTQAQALDTDSRSLTDIIIPLFDSA